MNDYINQVRVFKMSMSRKVDEFLFNDAPEPTIVLEVDGSKLELLCCPEVVGGLYQMLTDLIEEYEE